MERSLLLIWKELEAKQNLKKNTAPYLLIAYARGYRNLDISLELKLSNNEERLRAIYGLCGLNICTRHKPSGKSKASSHPSVGR